jgi:hypothetical protein
METYKFTTKISKSGSIKVPNIPDLRDKNVEVIIVLKNSDDKNDEMAEKFVNKWAGFLVSDDTDNTKYEYLSKKYK